MLIGPSSRRKAIKDLIARSAPEMDDWMTRGLVGSLKIPSTWVNEAKVHFLVLSPRIPKITLHT